MKVGIDCIGVSVGVLIINSKGQVFLTKRSQNVKNEKGCWEAPGGAVNFNEKLEDAIRREIKEELGVEIILIKQFPAQNHLIPAEGQHWIASTFLAKFKKGKIPKIMEPQKCDEIGWFFFTNLPKPLSIITKLDIEKYLEIS